MLHIWKAQGQGQIVQAVTSLRAPCLCSTARCWRRARARWCGRHTQRQSASVPVFCLRRGAEALTRYAANKLVAHAALTEALAVGQRTRAEDPSRRWGRAGKLASRPGLHERPESRHRKPPVAATAEYTAVQVVTARPRQPRELSTSPAAIAERMRMIDSARPLNTESALPRSWHHQSGHPNYDAEASPQRGH